MPSARIFSCTLIGPWSMEPAPSTASLARIFRGESGLFQRGPHRDGLRGDVVGELAGAVIRRLERGSNAAAGPSIAAHRRIA